MINKPKRWATTETRLNNGTSIESAFFWPTREPQEWNSWTKTQVNNVMTHVNTGLRSEHNVPGES